MTTPARQAEADRVEVVYHYALAQLGFQAVEESLELWHLSVPPTRSATAGTRWLDRAIRLIMRRRGRARDLALSYYRLVRALRTGATIGDPRRNESGFVSLEDLRDEFEAQVDRIAPQPAQEPSPDDSLTNPPDDSGESHSVDSPPSYEDAEYDEDDQILLEEIAELEAEADRQDREAEEELLEQLDKKGNQNLQRKLELIDEDQTATEVDAQRAEAHRKAGARQAAAAERITMNAARGLTYSLGEYDGRVMGWARYHPPIGTPCGWCAMLVSRGAIYKSRSSARLQGVDSDFDTYHDGCHCIAIPAFTKEQYDSSPLFDLNREYSRLWNEGDGDELPKKPTLSQWRKYMRQRQKQEAQTPAAA